MIRIRLHGKSPNTIEAYMRDISRFVRFAGCQLSDLRLEDLHRSKQSGRHGGPCWRDVQERGDAGQITVYGKGGKTRRVLLSADTWRELEQLRGAAGPNDPLLESRKGRRAVQNASLEYRPKGCRSRRC